MLFRSLVGGEGATQAESIDGFALDTFRLRRAFTSDEDEKIRANRIIETVKQLLQEAARACHKNVSEFLLDAGVTAAAQTLADRRQFVLDETQWQAFQEALDRPVKAKPRLKKLLREPGVLD